MNRIKPNFMARRLSLSLIKLGPKRGPGDRRGSRKPESREKRERVQKIPELADIQSILAAVTKSQTEQTLEPKTMTEIMADDDAAKEKVKAENYKQKKREMAMQVTSDMGWYESDVLANQPDSICPEFFAAQAAEYKSFLTQSYDDGYNKQWSNWIQGSYVQLPTTNEEGPRAKELSGPWQDHVYFNHFVNQFPTGQIKTFMSAAASGLSQNPFLSVAEKHEHLEFFRQYFVEREQDLVQSSIINKAGSIPRDPFLTPDGDGEWPSQKKIMERYEEMTPWGKQWYDLDKGPMTYRVRRRRIKLAQLENVDAAKKLELTD